nr:hypothetical protein [Denitromonas sp.]
MDSHDKPADLLATPSTAKRLLHRSLALAGLALAVLLALSGKWWLARGSETAGATPPPEALPAL